MKMFQTRVKNTAAGLCLIASAALSSCSQVDAPRTAATQTSQPVKSSLLLDYEQYQLDNGLTVILHRDDSDPVVAVSLSVNVGSAREKPGKTGLAHLFEHLLFLNSENLGYGGLDELGTRIGGSGSNGFTEQHLTQYFQSAPSDSLEKLIWAESEKLGFFINTVTQNALDVERQVVKNEKRQVVDDVPYGAYSEVAGQHLYPSDHPYHWQVLGSLEDLEAATLDDVKQFYKKWYVPNNATFVISGQFDNRQAKAMVQKYFGEIPRGQDIAPFTPRSAQLDADLSIFFKDKLVSVPLLGLTWPSVDGEHADAQALTLLAQYLTYNQQSPLTQVMVHEDKVTHSVSSGHFPNILAGEFEISASAKPQQSLAPLLSSIQKGLDRFEQNGVDQDQLSRIVNDIEASYFGGIEVAETKASYLGADATLFGDPNKTASDLQLIKAVTPEQIMAVYRKYIKGKAKLLLGVVPEGQAHLALNNAKEVLVKQEVTNIENTVIDFNPEAEQHLKTPSAIDRSEPPYGKPYTLPEVAVWQTKLNNGIAVSGVFNDETPLVQFSLSFPAGNKFIGEEYALLTPRYTAAMFNKGTVTKTREQFESRLEQLNASMTAYATDHEFVVQGVAYVDRLQDTLALLQEALLSPRWDEDELLLIKERAADNVIRNQSDNAVIARKASARVNYTKDHIKRRLIESDIADIRDISMPQLKQFHRAYYHPDNATFNLVGALTQEQVKALLTPLEQAWKKSNKALNFPKYSGPNKVERTEFYVKAIEGAKQSSIQISAPSITSQHPDYPKLEAVNLLLGGVFTSILNQKLRVEKGYTYGIGSSFNADKYSGQFGLSTRVRSNATYDSLETIKAILDSYADNLTEEDLVLIKSSISRYQATTTEALGSKLGVLNRITKDHYPTDYREKHLRLIQDLNLAELKRLTRHYIQADKLRWLVVGAPEQLENLDTLGLGSPVVL